jgi:hypothetical protein
MKQKLKDYLNFISSNYEDFYYSLSNNETLIIYTGKSKWKIILSDFYRFRKATLWHLNEREIGLDGKEKWHSQINMKNIYYGIFIALTHDIFKENKVNEDFIPECYQKFMVKFENYLVSKEIKEYLDIALKDLEF